jgi:hypothetical protein
MNGNMANPDNEILSQCKMLYNGMKGNNLFGYRNIIYYNCLRYNSSSPIEEVPKEIKDCLGIANLDISEKCLV